MAVRLRRRRSKRSTASQMKRYFQAFLFLIIVPIIAGLISAALTLIPETTIVLPGNIQIHSTDFLHLIVFVASIVMLISALARLGVRI